MLMRGEPRGLHIFVGGPLKPAQRQAERRKHFVFLLSQVRLSALTPIHDFPTSLLKDGFSHDHRGGSETFRTPP
jgi:hypothetical protein